MLTQCVAIEAPIGESAPAWPELGAGDGPQVRSCFLNLARLFWNQTWTRASVSSIRAASSSLFAFALAQERPGCG